MDGWIKLHRKLKESSFYHDSDCVHLWVHILLSVNKFDKKFLWNGAEVVIKSGQFITGRKKLSNETGIEESKIQRVLKKFEKCHMIEQQTNNRNRIITVVSWESHQESEQQMNNKRTTDERQMNTNKKVKKERKKELNSYVENSDEFQLAKLLSDLMIQNNPDNTTSKKAEKDNFQKWSDDIRKMNQIDKRTFEQIKYLINWSQKDSFWSSNIQSPSKLRDKFDTLAGQVKRKKPDKEKSLRELLKEDDNTIEVSDYEIT